MRSDKRFKGKASEGSVLPRSVSIDLLNIKLEIDQRAEGEVNYYFGIDLTFYRNASNTGDISIVFDDIGKSPVCKNSKLHRENENNNSNFRMTRVCHIIYFDVFGD